MNETDNHDEAIENIVGAPLPSSATRNESLAALRVAVARKNRRRKIVNASGAFMVIACSSVALLLDRESLPTNVSAPQAQIATPSRSYEPVSSQPSGFTTFRTMRPVALEIITSSSSSASVHVDQVNDAELLAMFPGSTSVLISGSNDQAPKFVIAHIADASTIAH